VLDFVCVKSDGSVSFLGPYMDRLLVDTNGYTTVTRGLDYVTGIRFIYSCVFGLRNIFLNLI